MDTPQDDPTQPQSPAPEPSPEQPQSPAPDHGPGQPRILTRSRSDRVLGGVCGGIGRYFGIDAVIVRIAAVALVLLGGAGVLLYLAALLLVPSDPVAGGPATAAVATSDRGRALGIVAVVVVLLFTWPFLLGGGFLLAGILVPIALLAVVGLVAWWLVSGASPEGEPRDVAKQALLGVGVLIGCSVMFAGGFVAAAAGGGTLAAVLVIGAGVALVAGAFLGRVRWLILPTLSLAMGVAIVSATGIDFDGGFGEREYRPTTVSEISDRYELAAGELTVDLRDVTLPEGDTPLNVDVGMGEVTVIVPDDVCVASRAQIGVGAIDVFDRNSEGADVNWRDAPRAAEGNSRLVLDADLGLGELQVTHDRPGFDGFRPEHFGSNGDNTGSSNTGCEGSSLSAGSGVAP